MRKLSGHANITLKRLIAAYQVDLLGLVGLKIPTHLRSVVSAEDVLQAVWIEIERCLRVLELETEQQFGPWIRAIARSCLLDALRNAQSYGRGDGRVVGQGKTSATGHRKHL